jgi:2-polyprenyl-6-methoxyphenol hydroxylase-like FAD-dependent oxidoreductase
MKGGSVLISGAGIAGPTLAYWLARCGFVPTLVERAPRFREGGYMIDFWGVGFDVAEQMNLAPRLREVGYSFNQIKFVDAKGRIRSQFGGNAFRRVLGDRFISLPRGDLAKAIFDTIAGNTEIIFDDSIVSIREDSAGVEVAFERSPPRRFDFAVGCDGLHSIVREIAFGPERKFEKYLDYYATSFLTADYPHRDELAYVSYGAPGRQVSRYALRDKTTAFLFVFARDHPFTSPVAVDQARQIVHETFARDAWIEIPEILERLKRCGHLYFDSVSQIRMPQWSSGRVVLAGDAAYCPSLLAGEGAAFAMAGAYILAGELGRAEGNYGRAFRTYEERFRAFIERKQRAAESFAGSFAPKTRFGLFVRDLVLRSASFPLVSGWLTRRFVSDRFELPDYVF